MHAHRRFPRSPLPSYILSLVCLLLFTTVTMSACNRSERQDTLHAAVIAVNAASDGFVTWDMAHQDAIVSGSASRDAALAAMESYRAKRQPVVDGFEVAYRTIALAATQTDDLSFKTALAKVSELIEAVKKLKGDL